MMASCSSVRELLPWFVGDDLDATCSDAVRVHLRDCPSCRKEAAALQQSTKALQSLGSALGAPDIRAPERGSGSGGSPIATGAGEAMFASMHDTIVRAVRAEAVRLEAPTSTFATRWLPLAAALMLFAAGWWCVRDTSSLQVLQRPAIDMPPIEVRVVPWAGPRVPLRPLGFELPPSDGGAESGIGQGMMGRDRLRDHAEELVAAPGIPIPKPH